MEVRGGCSHREQQQQNGKSPATAGIIIIGDEILKGRVQDVNTHYLCQQLWLCGVRVSKVVVVADQCDEIADEVRKFSSTYDYVLTTGGVGPTHDDVTIQAVGMAFEEECVAHRDILKFFSGGREEEDEEDEEDEILRKMALVPRSAEIHLDPSSNFMLVCVHNVHCYPGIPSLMKNIFQANKSLYMKEGNRAGVEFHSRDILIGCNEELVVRPLSLVQSEYPSVQLGSYPNTSPKDSYRVKLTLESEDLHTMDKAYTRLALLLPKDVMMSASEHHNTPQPPHPRNEIDWLLDRLPPGAATLLPPSLCTKLCHTLSVMEETYQRYGFNEVCVAFNGGKDCTAMLDLLHSYLLHKGHDFTRKKLHVLYIMGTAQFPEVEQFVEKAVNRYSLGPIRIHGLEIRDALQQLKTSHPQFKAIMMGTRKTDPFSSKLSDFSPTDETWPEYMRVNCLLDWSYMDVWMFLRTMSITYCSLYDKGYTSLDGVNDTHKNSHLAVSMDTQLLTGHPVAVNGYLPAYMLANEQHERAGRTK